MKCNTCKAAQTPDLITEISTLLGWNSQWLVAVNLIASLFIPSVNVIVTTNRIMAPRDFLLSDLCLSAEMLLLLYSEDENQEIGVK